MKFFKWYIKSLGAASKDIKKPYSHILNAVLVLLAVNTLTFVVSYFASSFYPRLIFAIVTGAIVLLSICTSLFYYLKFVKGQPEATMETIELKAESLDETPPPSEE